MPEQLRQSLTWDRGKELPAHVAFPINTGTAVYFAAPTAPGSAARTRNTNGALRQYFSKGTDLSRSAAEDLDAVAHALNTRRRKSLGWMTQAEAMSEHRLVLHQAGVATTC
jgi:IS30 family transposase